MQSMIVGALFPDPTQAHEAALFPKIRKSCRSFKEVAEVTISQLEFLLNRSHLSKDRGGPSQASTYRTAADEENLQHL